MGALGPASYHARCLAHGRQTEPHAQARGSEAIRALTHALFAAISKYIALNGGAFASLAATGGD